MLYLCHLELLPVPRKLVNRKEKFETSTQIYIIHSNDKGVRVRRWWWRVTESSQEIDTSAAHILVSRDTVCINWITGVPAPHNTRCASLDSGVIMHFSQSNFSEKNAPMVLWYNLQGYQDL